ncbi:MAG: TIGR02391 family protein [Sedimentisphaerales bacterium]
MADFLSRFENVVRRAYQFSETETENLQAQHPFDERNIHQAFPDIVKQLFDDGHYSQATFEAFKFIDKEIQRLSSLSETGFKLMMQVFADSSPIIQLTPVTTVSEKDEQNGYKFLFAGSVLAIRNPRGHEYSLKDSPDLCLDHLALASMLLRRLENAGYTIIKT